MLREWAVGPLTLNRTPGLLVAFVDEFEREWMRPNVEFFVADSTGDELPDEFGRQAVALQCGEILRIPPRWSTVLVGPVAARIPGIRVDDAGTQDAEADLLPVLEAKRIGEA